MVRLGDVYRLGEERLFSSLIYELPDRGFTTAAVAIDRAAAEVNDVPLQTTDLQRKRTGKTIGAIGLAHWAGSDAEFGHVGYAYGETTEQGVELNVCVLTPYRGFEASSMLAAAVLGQFDSITPVSHRTGWTEVLLGHGYEAIDDEPTTTPAQYFSDRPRTVGDLLRRLTQAFPALGSLVVSESA